MEHQESRCYPTGCEPCDVPINFPDSPVDGDRFCVDAKGYASGQKCWVYDKCIPGWRAEGPNTSPAAVYRGAINIKTEKPGANIEAGHFYVQTVDATQPYQPEWGLNISNPTVFANNRIAFNGQKWEVLPGPIVPYASEALGDVPLDADSKPDPDNRLGGIVKNATLSQAKAGVDKCDTITPYTLNGVLQPIKDELDDLPDNIATTNDILWEINGDDKLTPKDSSNEVLISNFTAVNDNQSIGGKLQIGSIAEAVTDIDDPATNDGRLTLASGTIKVEDAAQSVPATETRFAVFDEHGYIIVGGNPADFIGGGGGGGSQDLVLQTESATGFGRENDARSNKALNIPSWTELNANSQTTFGASVSQNSSTVFGSVNAKIQVQKAGLNGLAKNDADIYARATWSGSLENLWPVNSPNYNPPTVNWTEVTVPNPGGVPAELWVQHRTSNVTNGFRLVSIRFNTTLYYKS